MRVFSFREVEIIIFKQMTEIDDEETVSDGSDSMNESSEPALPLPDCHAQDAPKPSQNGCQQLLRPGFFFAGFFILLVLALSNTGIVGSAIAEPVVAGLNQIYAPFVHVPTLCLLDHD